jgi:cytochrome c553
MAARRPERRIIERLVERHRGEPFNELLRDPVFRQLSEADVMALAAEYRRQAKRIRAQSDGRPSAGARGFAGDKHGAGA